MQELRLALIAGSGNLPIEVAQAALQSLELKLILVVTDADSWKASSKVIEGLLQQHNIKIEFLAITEVDRALSILESHNINSIVFAGKVLRPPLKNLKLHGKAGALLAKILLQSWQGDDALLRAVNQFFANEGYKVLPAHYFSKKLLATKGHIAGPNLDLQSLDNLMLEVKRAKELGKFDIGQAIVVKDGYITAVEAAEGTDSMLQRVASLPEALRGGTLIKLAKPQQVMEIDLPTIGPETIANCAFSGINTILVEANRTNVIEINSVKELAKKHKITLYGVEVAEQKKGIKGWINKLFKKMTPEEIEAAIAALPSSELIIISGEASGDQLGASLLENLLKTNPGLKVSGIAGPSLRKHDTDWFGDIKDLSYFGIFEILPHLRKIKKFRDHVINQIMIRQPKVVVTIDSPAFSYHLIKKIKLICYALEVAPPTCIHYVAPSVWAYKESRAQKFARYFNHLLTLLPFEPQYFTYYGLKSSFVGHHVVELYKHHYPSIHKLDRFINKHRRNVGRELFSGLSPEDMELCGIDKLLKEEEALDRQTPLPPEIWTVGLFPGSRPVEVKRHLPILCNMVAKIDENIPVKFKIIVPESQMEVVTEYLGKHLPKEESRVELVSNQENFVELASSIDFALAKSGTVVVQLAALGVPLAVFYKLNSFTSILAKLLLKTQWVSLPNILAGKELIPEFLQENATADNLAEQVKNFVKDPSTTREQIQGMHEVMNIMGAADVVTPSQKAAEVIESYLAEE